MEYGEGILILVVIGLVALLVFYFWSQSKSANRKVFNKKRYQEELYLTQRVLLFTARSSVEQLEYQLSQHVITEDGPPKINPILYVKKASDGIVYIYGNKFTNTFVALLTYSENRGAITARFNYVSWLELDGVSHAVERMRDLADSIQDAFHATDPNVQITEHMEQGD